VRCRRAKRCHGVFCNVPMVLMACFSTRSNSRERPEGSSAAPERDAGAARAVDGDWDGRERLAI
jgi:hypothetical protein